MSNEPAPGSALAALAAAVDAVARGGDLDATVGAVLEATLAATGATSATLLVQDPDRPGLELVGAIGLGDAAIARAREAAADPTSPAAVAARTGAATFGDTAADLPLVTGHDGIDRTLGVASFAWPAGTTPDPEQRLVVEAAAGLLAVAIHSWQLASLVGERSEWFERMAHTDPLTGLANSRTFARVLELEVARAGRQGGEVSLAIFDVDDFGATNEAAGHDAGDDVLRAVASLLAESVRLVDTVARYGGDEFVVVAPGAAGATVARRVLEGVAALPEVGGRPVTISAGIARFPADAVDTEGLIAAAEAALARSRAEGRGRMTEAGGGAAGETRSGRGS